MPDTIKQLAGRLFRIDHDELKEVSRFGADAAGNLVFTGTTSGVFHAVEFLDVTKKSRLRLRVRSLELFGDLHNGPSLQFVVPFPAVVFPDISDLSGHVQEIQDFLCRVTLVLKKKVFHANGSVNIAEYHAHYDSWDGDTPPQNETSYLKQGPITATSLKEMTEGANKDPFELPIFGTNAKKEITERVYPTLARVFTHLRNCEFKDRLRIEQNDPDNPLQLPRAVGIKPAGIRASADSDAFGSLSFSAIVGLGPQTTGTPARADFQLDDRLRANGISFKQIIDIEFIPDAHNDRFLANLKGDSQMADEFRWYIRARPVPVTLFSTVWNERIAKPYLDALRTTDDARDLSFVPLLENLKPLPDSDGKESALDLIFDVVQRLQPDPKKPSAIGKPILIALRPNNARSIRFLADASFPGLLTHDGQPVKRRVQITIERKRIDQTFESFDTPLPEPGNSPELIVSLKADDTTTEKLTGGTVRVGALDLRVPDKAAAGFGAISIDYRITFDPADARQVLYGTADHDAKGRPGRARLPRFGEAIPRVAAQINWFELADVQPGSQDPVPDAAQAFDAVLERLAHSQSNDPRTIREQRIAGNLARDPAIVIVDAPVVEPAATPFFLRGEEITKINKNRRLGLTLHRRKTDGVKPDKRTIVIDPEPMTIALIDVPSFELDKNDTAESDGEIANWQTSELEGARWEIARIEEGFNLFFPPQATGEAAEKGAPWLPISGSMATTIDYRIGTLAKLHLRSSYFKQRYAEAPWNLRRVLGYAGQRAPGAGLDTARFEYLYGLAARFTAPGLRLAEIGSRIGAVRDPLPARPLGIARELALGTLATESKQPLVESELYDRFRDISASLTKAYGTRVAVFETYREGSDEPLSLEDKVAFDLRVDQLHPEPWKSDSTSDKFRGGATWGFESRNIFEEVTVKSPTVSRRGQIVNPSFSALGGSGFIRAFFANGKTRIVSDTTFGRTHTYAVERIGRIGVFWNVAKHVIVYERTVLPSDQFGEDQKGQHFGRPILRKVKEYVDILEPDRAFPEKGAALNTRGFVEACLFRTHRIPVTSRWGRDVPEGWVVPLWRQDADRDIYPKPDVRLQLTGAHTDATAIIASRFEDPSQLVFFTSTRTDDGDDPNVWPARPNIDFVNVPRPRPADDPTLDSSNPDGSAPDDNMRDALVGRCTFNIDTATQATNLVAERTKADPVGAVLETVTMMRSAGTGSDGGEAGAALSLRNDLDRILGNTRRLEGALTEALAAARRVLGSLLELRTLDQTQEEIKAKIKAALDAEIGRLDEVKNLVHREAAFARQAINQAVGEATTKINGVKKGWTDAAEEVEGRLKSEIQSQLTSRMATLSAELGKVSTRLDEILDGAGSDRALVLARRVEEILAPIRLTVFSNVGKLGDGLSRIEAAINTFEGEINSFEGKLKKSADELTRQLDTAATTWNGVLECYEQHHSKALSVVESIERITRGDLPRWLREDKRFAAGTQDIRQVIQALRQALIDIHNKVIADVSAMAKDKLDDAKTAVKLAAQNANAAVNTFKAPAVELITIGKGLLKSANDKVEEYSDKFEQKYDSGLEAIYKACRKAGDTIDTIKANVKHELDLLKTEADGLTNKANQVGEEVFQLIKSGFDEIGKAADDRKKDITDRLTGAQANATAVIDDLEQQLISGLDAGIAELKKYVDGAASDIAAVLAGAAAKIRDTTNNVTKDISDKLRKAIPPEFADDVRVLEEGYNRLSKAPTFQNPDETLALIRAAGSSPILPNLKFNRERIAYFFDDARDAVMTSPIVALMNRAGDDLKALGIRVPSGELLDRLIPKNLEKFDFGKLFPDLGGIKLDGLFKNLRLPASLNDKVKVTHGFDKASLTGWAKAEATSPFPSRSEVFEFGPLKLAVLGANFSALADIAISADGSMKRSTKAELVGNWELAFSGQPLVTLEKTRVFFENGKGLDVDIDPTRIRFDRAIQFLSDLIKSFSEPNSGFFLEMLEDNGMPAGLAARLDLPLPPLSFGAFSVWGLRFSSSFELLMVKGTGGKRGDFALGTTLALGRKSEPFIMRVWILVGGGWLETRAKYFPSTGKLISTVSIGLTAGLGLDFAFGPCRGFVFAMFGAYVEFSSGDGNSFSIAVIFMIRGGIVILGRFNIGLYLLLELIYQGDGSVIGRGTIEVSFKICWCCEIKVRQGVTYNLRKGSGSSAAAAPAVAGSASTPRYLDNFA